MSDGIFQPNKSAYVPMPIPDKVRARDGSYFNPNAAYERDPADAPTDKRPVKILEEAGYDSAEEWGNAILYKKIPSTTNGGSHSFHIELECVDSLGNPVPGCDGKGCIHSQRVKGGHTHG